MLIRKTLLYLPAQIVGPIFLFGSVIVWTHLLDPAALGTFALVTATQELAYAIITSWFSFWMLRYIGRFGNDAEGRRFLDTEAPILLVTLVASSLVGALVLPLIGSSAHGAPLMIAAAGYVSTRTITTHFAERARAQEDIVSYSILATSGPVLGLAIGVAIALLVAPTPAAALGGLAIAQVLGLALVLPRMRLGSPTGPWDREMLKAAFRYGLPFLLTGPLIWLSANGIRFIVELALGSAAVGLLTVGWALGQRGAAVTAMMTTAAAYPLAVKRTREEGTARGAEQLGRNGILLFLLLAPAMGGLVALGPQIIDLLVAAPYRAVTIDILPYAALAGLIQNMRLHFTNQIYLLIERPSQAVIVDLTEALALVILCTAGVYFGGIKGAVIGALLAMIIGIATSIAHGRRTAGLTVPYLELARVAAATMIMVALLQFVPRQVGWMLLVGEIALGAVIYAISILVLYPRALTELKALARGRRGMSAPPPS